MNLTGDIPRGSPNSLNQGGGRAEETLFVCVKNRHKGYLREVETLPEQVDPNEHIKYPGAQFGQQLYAAQRVNIGVQIANLNPRIVEIIGEVL